MAKQAKTSKVETGSLDLTPYWDENPDAKAFLVVSGGDTEQVFLTDDASKQAAENYAYSLGLDPKDVIREEKRPEPKKEEPTK